jgi:hypothetical protein
MCRDVRKRKFVEINEDIVGNGCEKKVLGHKGIYIGNYTPVIRAQHILVQDSCASQ